MNRTERLEAEENERKGLKTVSCFLNRKQLLEQTVYAPKKRIWQIYFTGCQEECIARRQRKSCLSIGIEK